MALIILSIIGIALVMLVMSVGAIMSNRCLRGSCGGGDVIGPDGELLTCDTCPLRSGPRHAPDAAHSHKGAQSVAAPGRTEL